PAVTERDHARTFIALREQSQLDASAVTVRYGQVVDTTGIGRAGQTESEVFRRPADHLVLRPSENRRCGRVPARQRAVRRNGGDPDGRRFQNGLELCSGLLSALDFATDQNVEEECGSEYEDEALAELEQQARRRDTAAQPERQ